jgi:Protein of unknown function (DUF1488)
LRQTCRATIDQGFVLPEIGEAFMPLEQGKIIGYDADRMTFEFTMMDKTKIIDCSISSVAMDEMASSRGTRPADREAQFSKFRELIERIASNLFDEQAAPKGTVRISSYQVHGRSRPG